MDFTKKTLSKFVAFALLGTSSGIVSNTVFAGDWIVDGSWESSNVINDYQPWEYDSCLRNDRVGTEQRQFRFISLNNDVDMMRGSAHIDVVDYDSSHETLPLKLERIYKTSGSFEDYGKLRTKWFSSLDYRLNVADGIKSAKSAAQGNVQEPECDGYTGWGDRPLVLAQGTGGALSLYGKVNASSGVVEWYKRKQRSGSGYTKVNLVQNSDGSWTYYDADTATIQKYNSAGKILSITDAATHISLTWSYTSSYTRITRTGGEWLEVSENSSGNQTVKTSSGNTYTYAMVTPSSGNPYLKVTYPNNDYRVYYYTSKKLVKSEEIKGFGVVRQWAWNDKGLVTSQTTSDGDKNTFTFSGLNATNNTTDVEITAKNSEGRTATFIFDGQYHELSDIKGAGGGLSSTETSFNYSAHGYAQTVTETDPLGNIKEHVTNSKGWTTSESEAVGTANERTTTTSWLSKWHLPQIIETENNKTQYTYYSEDRPLVTSVTKTDKITGKTSKTTYQYAFYSNGLISKITINGPRTDIQDVSYQYFNSSGRLTKEVDSLGHTTQYSAYDADGHLTKVIYPDGTTKTKSYNNRGWIAEEATTNNKGTATNSYQYDARGNVVKETNPDSVVVSKVYNDANNLSYITRGDERKIFSYDDLGKLAKERVGTVDADMDDKVGQESCEVRDREEINCVVHTIDETLDDETKIKTFTHDALGRLVSETDSRGYSTKFGYDLLNRRVTTTDAKGNVVERLTYDSLGRVKTTKDAVGRLTTYNYDADDNVTSIKDNASRQFSYEYDGFDQLLSSNTPTEGNKSFEYDDAGNVTDETLNDGSSIHYTFDELNRMTARTMSDGEEHQIDYDTSSYGVGLIGKTTEASGSTTYSYNSLNRKISGQQYIIDGSTFHVSYTYTSAGNLSSITYPSGYKVNYTYDAKNGKVTSVKDSSGATLASSIKYNPYGPIKSYSLLGNGTVTLTRDEDYRLTKISSTNYKAGYNYDTVGHIVSKLNSSGSAVRQFTYFNNYELKSESGGGKTASYTYDSIGNRKSETGITYTYNSNGKLSAYNGKSVNYDARGNVTSDSIHGSSSRSYNVLNQLSSITRGSYSASYEYDALGHRTAKNTNSGDYSFIYDVNGQLLAESLNGVIKKEYVYLGNTLVSVRYSGANYPVLSDITGRPEVATNASGTIAWQASNNAFSRSISKNTIGGLNIGYPGQYYDKESDTWYNLARDYDATTGRYLQSDPQGTVDGPNTYVYAGNNPVNRVDPNGEFFWAIVGAAVDIGLQAYENNWDFSKVDYVEVAVNSINPLKIAGLASKGYHIAQEARQAASAGAKVLSEARGIVAKGSGEVATSSRKVVQEASGNVTKGVANFTEKQLAKKFKHASDFGVNTTKKNPQTLAEFQNAITSHLGDAATVQKGTYGFVKDSKVFFNSNTNNAVVLDNAGNFVTGFKLSPGTPQFENFMTNGLLR